MAKKIILKSRPEAVYYTMIGISCHLMDYRFLHMLNKELGSGFSREEDLVINSPVTKEEVTYSLFSYRDEDHRNSFYLISNYSEDHLLIQEFRNTDFIMLIEGDFKKQRKDALLMAIRKISSVLTAFEINIRDIKTLESFLTDLEMHITTIRKDNRQKTK